jgi:tRNA(Arg) A34 adenosine deaminase TadA
VPSIDALELTHLARAVEVASDARAHGNHPFGAVLVTREGILVEAENTVVTHSDPTGHAETNLVRRAAEVLSSDELRGSTLYTSTEPCAMCCGAIFWAGIPRVVYALAESELIAMVPVDSAEGTLALPSREVFARGGRATEVIGPVDAPGAVEVHAGFWA